jgi:broad specificity phosphatase PhoE
MSRLILVRHAQASFGAADYDQLSSLGEAQALALGEYWLRIGNDWDEVVVGPRKRHARTAEIIGTVYREHGRCWPVVEASPGFDEHFVDELLGKPLEILVDSHPVLRPLVEDYRVANRPEQLQRSFQRLFEALCHLWRDGAPGTESIEPWPTFQFRVESALREILHRPGRSRRIAVIASVGSISVALGYALQCTPARAFELGWRLKNTSVSELIFTDNRITLDQFNSVAHLPEVNSWTFR